MIGEVLRPALSIAATILIACSGTSLSEVSAQYLKSGDADSLDVIVSHLKPGMLRGEVEELLGQPNYSPTEGQYYYSSSREVSVGEGLPLARYGLVVDYRIVEYLPGDIRSELTERLQSFHVGPIGE